MKYFKREQPPLVMWSWEVLRLCVILGIIAIAAGLAFMGGGI